MTRVLVAAQSPVARAGLEALLSAAPELSVVGTESRAGGTGSAETADRIAEHRPDVVLLELAPGDTAEDALALGGASLGGTGEGTPAPAVVLVGAARADALVAADALRLGARGVLPAAATGAEIVAAVEAAAAGLVAVHPEIIAALAGESRVAGATRAAVRVDGSSPSGQPLTPRELEVLTLLAEGLGNKQIAGRLGISDHTVKYHVAAVFEKLGAGTRAEAVVIGARRGMLML